MKIDAHVHTGLVRDSYAGAENFNREAFMNGLHDSGLDGAVILSPKPEEFSDWSPEKRMQDTLDVCGSDKNLYPFYWIHPFESDCLDQVDLAVEKGFAGFKMICSTYNPGCDKSLQLLEKIASVNKPVLFHSGICWDGRNSANNNRPGNFEALIDIPHLKFCLAHVSWPWFDECIAVYGKFNNAYFSRPETSCEMFIDCTPGTPRVYREEVFRHLLCSDYELRYNLIFGTDSNTGKYNSAWANEWQARDNALYEKFIPNDLEDFKDHIYGKNILRFMGLSDEDPVRKIPMVAE